MFTPPVIHDSEFQLFQRFVYESAGIFLSPIKKGLVAGRLSRRLKELELRSFREYFEYATKTGDPAEVVRMLDCITTNETSFFREPHHFEFLRNEVFPRLEREFKDRSRPARMRVWSAGCSSGEEPYSIAMTLLERFSPERVEIEVLGTDLSSRMLARASEAVWPLETSADVPPELLKRFMLRGVGTQAGKMCASNELRQWVRFQRLNLNDDHYPLTGKFDVIFCRNVMIYFDSKSKQKVVERLLRHLEPNGYLFVGHAESLSNMSRRVRSIGPTIYTHRGASEESPCC